MKSGPSWLANEVAACRRCNSERRHETPASWLQECLRRGWPADTVRLRRVLDALDREIASRGGQRRTRPYVAHQLRRVTRLGP